MDRVVVELKDEVGYLALPLTALDEEAMDQAVSMCREIINTALDEIQASHNKSSASRSGM